MKKIPAMVIVLIAGVLAVPAIAGESVRFSYLFRQGSEQAYKISFNQDIDAGAFTMNRFADFQVVEKCVAVSDSNSTMEMTFVKVESSRRFGETLQDDKMGTDLTGKKVRYTVNADGGVDNVTSVGYIEGWSKMTQILTPVIESGYVFLPDTNIAVGNSWDRKNFTQKVGGGLSSVTSVEFLFKEMKKEKGRECARVTGNRHSTMAGKLQLGAKSADASGKSTGKFEFYFDPATSMIVKLKSKVEATIALTDDEGQAHESTFSYNIEREIR